MTKAKLLFDLIRYINAKRAFTAQDVAYEFGISVRTAHRYLAEAGEMGVPLYTEQGRNGGYRVLNNKLLPPIMFNEEEAFSIFFAFQSLRYYRSLPFDIEIKSVSAKLRANLSMEMRRKIDRLDAVLSFWNRKRNVPARYLKDIVEAAAEQRIMLIEYASKAKNAVKEVSPIGIYAYDGFWYMPARDLADGKVKLFRSDRLLSLTATEKRQDPQVVLGEWLSGLTAEPPAAPIRLYVELTREGIRQCRSQPWLEPDLAVANEDQGYVDTLIDRSEIDFAAKYFLQLGTDAKVVESAEIVERMRSFAQELLRHYRRPE